MSGEMFWTGPCPRTSETKTAADIKVLFHRSRKVLGSIVRVVAVKVAVYALRLA